MNLFDSLHPTISLRSAHLGSARAPAARSPAVGACGLPQHCSRRNIDPPPPPRAATESPNVREATLEHPVREASVTRTRARCCESHPARSASAIQGRSRSRFANASPAADNRWHPVPFPRALRAPRSARASRPRFGFRSQTARNRDDPCAPARAPAGQEYGSLRGPSGESYRVWRVSSGTGKRYRRTHEPLDPPLGGHSFAVGLTPQLLLLDPAHTDVQLAQLLVVHAARGVRKQTLSALRFGKRDDVADRLRLAHQRHDPVEAEGNPPMRGRAILQRVEEEAELRTCFIDADVERREHFRLHVLAMDTHRPAADLPTIEHHVVSL